MKKSNKQIIVALVIMMILPIVLFSFISAAKNRPFVKNREVKIINKEKVSVKIKLESDNVLSMDQAPIVSSDSLNISNTISIDQAPTVSSDSLNID